MAGRILPDLTVVAFPQQPTEFAPKKGRGRYPGRARFTVQDVISRQHMTNDAIAAELGCSLMTVHTLRQKAGLIRKRLGKRQARQTRLGAKDHLNRIAHMPPVNHPALSGAHTIYPLSVSPVEGTPNVLVSGNNSWKIGSLITKGRWKGFPIYMLTLEERATCPTSCAVWRSCYGNAMNFAKRLKHGAELEDRLGHELAVLQSRHPAGFACRLHILGDFYSVEYVRLWRSFLDRFPALHVFGFSARHDVNDPIAIELVRLITDKWERFSIRLSNAPMLERSTITIEHPLQKPPDAVICPQQEQKTDCCATCAFCWQSEKRVAFLRH